MNQPFALVMTIMDMRAYVAAKHQIEDAKETNTKLPDHPAIDMVWEVVAELAKEERERRGRS